MESPVQPPPTSQAGPENSDADRLRNDLDNLRRDFAQLADSVRGASRQGARAGADAARAGMDQAQQQVRDTVANLSSEIQARPLASVAGAFAVGLLLGKLFTR